jgi:phospholipid/cholesterol/gamma-HCH transport system substrate-binding protein
VASIEFQGLTGAPVVALAGGSPGLPLLAPKSGDAPLLIAEKNAGQGMAQAARDVLRRIDGVVAENAEPLKSLIANIDKFAGALARNSDKVDGIVAGIERFTGGGVKVPPRIIELAAPRSFPVIEKLPTTQLHVPEATALGVFDSEKVLIRRTDGGEVPNIGNLQWPDMLPKVVQLRVLESFENAKYMRAIGRAPDGVRNDFQLLIEIRRIQLSGGATMSADVELAAKIIGNDGAIAGANVFKASRPVEPLDAETVGKALSAAFEQVAVQLVTWTLERI